MNNINTKSYWDNRFFSGDWENKAGREQTKNFALSQIRKIEIPKDFAGTILDFGCGLGDAFPVYKSAFPKAKLLGVDISETGIQKCKDKYGHLAEFICGSSQEVPMVDIIISSNVFEHLSDDKEIAKELMQKCQQLYIIVPYKEKLKYDQKHEHVNSYNEASFNEVSSNLSLKIYHSKGWGPEGMDLFYNLYFKNIVRGILKRALLKRPKQIMFILKK